ARPRPPRRLAVFLAASSVFALPRNFTALNITAFSDLMGDSPWSIRDHRADPYAPGRCSVAAYKPPAQAATVAARRALGFMRGGAVSRHDASAQAFPDLAEAWAEPADVTRIGKDRPYGPTHLR